MFRKDKSVIGLDLGSQVVKAVEITLEGPEPVVTGFARAEISPGAGVNAAIAEVFQQGGFHSREVVTAVSGQAVVVRYITMVEMSDSELRQAIRFESDKYLPFDADDVILDCQRLSRDPAPNIEGEDASGQMSVVLAACRSTVVHDQMQAVTEQGLTPIAVDIDVFALANAWDLCGLQEEPTDEQEHSVALVDIGAARTSINVLCGGETCFSREIGIGGSDMTQAAARRLGVDVVEAEAIKRGADGREAEVGRAISSVLEDLSSEISLSLDYVESREAIRVNKVLLSGGAILAPGTVAFIESALGRQVRVWNPLEGLRVSPELVEVEELEANAASLTVAIGLASRVRAS